MALDICVLVDLVIDGAVIGIVLALVAIPFGG